MAFPYQALWDEIKAGSAGGDPLSRGYAASSASAVADNLNDTAACARTRNRATMEAYEVFNAIKKSEFNDLTSASQEMVWNILNNGTVNPFGLEATIFVDIFGSGASTINQLKVDRKDDVSRAAELGFGTIKEGHVIKARAQFGGGE